MIDSEPRPESSRDVDTARAISLYNGGLSIQDVANILDIPKSTLRYRLFVAGVQFDAGARISSKAKGRPSLRKGVKLSPETCLKMSAARKGVPGKKGFRFSEESKARMSATRKAMIASDPEMMTRIRANICKKDRNLALAQLRTTAKRHLSRLLKMPRTSMRRKIETILGYTKEDLLEHLRTHKSPGVDIEVRNSYHIDHVIPIDQFVREGVFDLRVVNALDNLQALTPQENRAKSNQQLLTIDRAGTRSGLLPARY